MVATAASTITSCGGSHRPPNSNTQGLAKGVATAASTITSCGGSHRPPNSNTQGEKEKYRGQGGDVKSREEGSRPGNIDWVVLQPKRSKAKVRKPVEINWWFGDEVSDMESEGSSLDDSEWLEVDRKRLRNEKRRRAKQRRRRREEETCTKARAMLGVGPVTLGARKHFKELTENKTKARELIVRDILQFHPGFQ